MSEVCEDCPLRGDLECRILGSTATDQIVKVTYFKNWEVSVGKIGALIDYLGNTSEPLNFSQAPAEATDIDTLEAKVNNCHEPTPSEKWYNRLLKRSPTCSALGDLAIDRSFSGNALTADVVKPRLALQGKLMAIKFARAIAPRS